MVSTVFIVFEGLIILSGKHDIFWIFCFLSVIIDCDDIKQHLFS